MFVFPPHLSSGSTLSCETENPEIASFHFNIVCFCANKHTKHIQIISWSQLNQPSFLKWSTWSWSRDLFKLWQTSDNISKTIRDTDIGLVTMED